MSVHNVVVEAVAAGCVPVLPARQSYPEMVPGEWHDASLYTDGDLTDRLRAVLTDLPGWRTRVSGLDAAMRRFDWRTVIGDYDDRLEALVRRSRN